MNIPPARQQHCLLLDHDLHRLPNFGPGHAFGSDQFGGTACSGEIDLGLTITKDVDVSGHMIVHKYDHAQAVGSEYGNHAIK
jgi:hypothetical protein